MASDAKAITHSEITDLVESLSGWQVEGGKLHKTFKFKDFSEAMGWMVRVAIEAEKLDHHPDWSNSWNKVDVYLLTHSLGALSQHDAALAMKMDELAR